MERLFDIKDAARFLNVSEMTIRRWTNSVKLKCYRVGGRRERRFHKSDLEELLHDSQNHSLKPLGFRGQKAPDGSHMAHFYSGNSEALGVSVPYLVEGVKRGEALLVVMPPERSRELLENLDGQNHPVATWRKNGRLTVTAGMDSPEEMIRYLEEFATRTHKFRVVGDMTWAALKDWDLAALSALEQSPTLMTPVENSLLLCQYNLEDFSGKHIMMAAEFHQHTIYKGRLEKSPYYTRIQ